MPVPISPILLALADFYESSKAGRSGKGKIDVQPTFEELCDAASRRIGMPVEGDTYELARNQLEAEDGKSIRIEWDDDRSKSTIHKVRLSPEHEAAFFSLIRRESPTQLRERWVDLFKSCAALPIPDRYAQSWAAFCSNRAKKAANWTKMDPFRMRDFKRGKALLREILVPLLGWEGSNLIRWVSSHLYHDSKLLERCRGTMESLLREATGELVSSFVEYGIHPTPRKAEFFGPLRFKLRGEWINYGLHVEPLAISLADIQTAHEITCTASRCLTVEGKTPFFELARSGCSDVLFVWTSFANDATLALLRRISECNPNLEFWHFGDADPQGFHILSDLRNRTKLPIHSLGMRHRPYDGSKDLSPADVALLHRLIANHQMSDQRGELKSILTSGKKGHFEQENLQPPPSPTWPFYEWAIL